MVGIYAIVNNEKTKVYLGKSRDITKRWRQHLADLNSNCHHNKELQSDWWLFGRQSFSFHVVQECTEQEIDFVEKEIIRNYRDKTLYNYDWKNHPWSNGFNNQSGQRYVKDADGDLLPVKKCPNCELDKLTSSFINSLYCYECQTNIETELQEETQIFETTSFLTGISSAPEGKPIIKHSNN